ncbi:hypothetical protein ACFXNW_06285 [Nocardia sp. NPDC059180]|uniref:hypothetical protein n=1 Tax=Nocardia sp. NPDC059180 TaxID=3346761 RepID=UPI003689EA88
MNAVWRSRRVSSTTTTRAGRFNIVGQTVTLWGTIRCAVESDMSAVQTRLRTLATHTAQAYNCTATVEYMQEVPAVHNLAPWVDAGLPTLRKVVGDDRVVQTSPPMTTYTEISFRSSAPRAPASLP